MIVVEDLRFVDVREFAKYGAFAGAGRDFRDISLRYPFLSRLRTFRYRLDEDARVSGLDFVPC